MWTSWREQVKASSTQAWGDGSVQKVMVIQTRGSRFGPRNPSKKPDVLARTGEVVSGVPGAQRPASLAQEEPKSSGKSCL